MNLNFSSGVEREVALAIHRNDQKRIHHLLMQASASLVPEGCGPLHMAANLGLKDCVRYLIGRTIDYATVNLQDQLGWSPLMYAVANKHLDIVQLFLKTDQCEVNLQDNYEQTALHIVTQSSCDCSKQLVNMLLSNGADIDSKDCLGMTPFLRAIENENIELSKYLYAKNCDTNASSNTGLTSLHLAMQKSNEELLNWLLSIGCDVNACDKEKRSSLMVCVQLRKQPHLIFRLMKLLMESGADINHCDSSGNSVILLAIGNPSMIRRHHIELLIVAGADVDTENSDGLTPLWQAVYDGIHYSDRIKIIQLLLHENCQLDKACRGKLLFTSGLDSVYCYENEMTAFEVAMDSGFYEAAKMLILAGCEVNCEMYIDLQSAEVSPDLQWFRTIITNPASLQQQCRLLVRRVMGKTIKNRGRRLPLPEKVKGYILLDDIAEML